MGNPSQPVTPRESGDVPVVVGPQVGGSRVVRWLVAVCLWSLGLVLAGALVWFVSGVPPAFIGPGPRIAALAWLIASIAGLVVARRLAHRSKTSPTGRSESRWPVWTPPWVAIVSGALVIGGMVALTFVIDGALPALVLGPDPGRSIAKSSDFTEASNRRDVDRTRIRFENNDVVVDTWAADPDYVLSAGTPVVFDTDNPRRVMPESTWEKERSKLWQFPIAVLLWLGVLFAPVAVRRFRSRWYGSLQPGLHIVKATRVRRSKVVRLEWDDGSSANFVDVPGFGAAVEQRLKDDGDEIPLPWTRPAPEAG